MHQFACFAVACLLQYCVALERKAPSRVAVTPHVLSLSASSFRYPHTSTSNYLTKRFNAASPLNHTSVQNLSDNDVAELQNALITIAGRVYMTNITLASRPYTMVIDTGSSDTWIASTSFQCISQYTRRLLPQKECGFGRLYDEQQSKTLVPISTHNFGVRYADGEFLSGMMATEVLGIGEGGESALEVRQTIGIVERGWWIGDNTSSGLMGLAYPSLASNARDLNYTSFVFSLFEDGTVPSIFSLALSRSTADFPRAGGVLAIGGIPDIPHVGDFVSVPIQPFVSTAYTFYSISIDGFEILPPTASSTAASLPPTSITTSRPRKKQKGTMPLPLVFNTTSGFYEEPEPLIDPELADYTSMKMRMVIDSGTTLMYLPNSVVDHIASLFSPPATYVEMANIYAVDCDAKVPRLGVVISNRTFWIDKRDLINDWGSVTEDDGIGNFVTGGRAQRMCGMSIQRQGEGDAVLGDSFLKNVIAVFDVGDNEMRFAARGKY